MWTIRRVFVVVASIAGLVAGAAGAEAPKLQYQFENGKHYGYDITIKVDTEDYAETYTGYCLFRGVPAKQDRIALACQAYLDAAIKWKRDAGLTFYGPKDVHSIAGQILLDGRGKLLGSMMHRAPLPYILGFVETLTLEKLPAEPLSQWQWEDEFKMMESRSIGPGMPALSPSRNAKEEIDYTITGVEGDLVRIDKKYLMRTGEAVAQAVDSVSRARMDGTGKVVFDRRAGVVASIAMKYTLLLKKKDDSRTVTASVDCRLMNPDRLEQFLNELDNKRKQATGEAYAEIPKKPLDKAERAKLLRDLRSRDPRVVEAAAIRLISAPADERPADFAVPLAKILREGKSSVRLKAAQALIVWATPEVEAALVEATGDRWNVGGGRPGRGFPLAEAAYKALATIGTESAARTIAENIIEPSRTPIEVLKQMGAAAETVMIELVLDETGGNVRQRAACEVLAEIGGLQSVPALQRATQGWRAQTQAQAALEAIAKREGLSVEELIEKAGPLATATVPGPSPAPSPGLAPAPETTTSSPFSSGVLRTWTDSSGKFTIEAEMVRSADGVVTLKKADGSTLDVPIDRLSQADRDLINADPFAGPGPAAMAQPSPKPIPRPGTSPVSRRSARPRPHPSARPTGGPGDTALVGGSGGFEFRFVGRAQEPLLGIQFRTAHWQGAQAVALTGALFDRNMRPVRGVVIAKPGYAVGGMNVDAQKFVNALEIIFMRLKPDGSLDPADSYKTWIGTPSGQPTKALGGTGAAVIGIYGRRAAILDAVGLVMQ